MWQIDLFAFERAIQTAGRQHTYVQFIRTKPGLEIKPQATMGQWHDQFHFYDLREWNSDWARGAMANDENMLVITSTQKFQYQVRKMTYYTMQKQKKTKGEPVCLCNSVVKWWPQFWMHLT